MKNFRLVVLFLFGAAWLGAQNSWQISGYVRSESGEALPGALAQINDSMGAVSNAEGYFVFRTAQRPAELTLRCLGYFPRRFVLRNDDFNGTRALLEVVLTAQETALQEVSITAKRVETLAEENFSTDIYDYVFAGEHLLLLMRDRKRYYARLVSESGEKLDEIQLDGQPTMLYRSCTGSLHLAGDFFAQELTLNGLHIDTFPRYALQKFRQFVLPCVMQYKGYYYFRVRGLFNKSVSYYYFDPERRRYLLAVIEDAAGKEEAMAAYGALRTGAPLLIRSTSAMEALPGIGDGFGLPDPGHPVNVFSDESLQHYANSNDQLAHWSWMQVIKSDSVYAPLIKVNDTLLLFDHINGDLYRFSTPPLQDKKEGALSYQNAAGWQREILKDETTQALYAHFAPGNRHALRRIDTGTGRTAAEYPLPDVPLISRNFKMRNGFLYCLGQPQAGIPNAGLYKVNIFSKP